MSAKQVSAVIPAFNEEENIAEMIVQVDDALGSMELGAYEIIVVDDGSKDRTGEIADGLSKQYSGRLHVIHHKENRGYADALRTGFENARCSLVFFTDSDRQFDMNEITRLLDKIDECDIVCGYRVNRQDPWRRIFISRVYNKVINLFFGLHVKDVDCAFNLFRKSVFDNIQIERKGFAVNLEVLWQAKRKGYSIIEVPVSHYKRPAGSSTVSLKALIKTIHEIIRLRGA